MIAIQSSGAQRLFDQLIYIYTRCRPTGWHENQVQAFTLFVETIMSTVICLLPRSSCHVFQRCVRFKFHFCVMSRIRLKNTRDCGKDKHDASCIDSCVCADKILSPYLALPLSAENVSFLQCASGCFCIVAVEKIVFCKRKVYGCFEDFSHCWNNQQILLLR
jgi:hypothetical protein